MGLGDAPKKVNLDDLYPEGTPFLIQKAWVEGVVKTQFGDRTMGKLLVAPVGDPAGQAQEVAVWGSLCEQVQQVEEGDVPGVYRLKKDGQRWLFEPVPDADVAINAGGEQTAAEADLGVTPAAGEGTPPSAEATATAEATPPPADPPPAAPPAPPAG